MGWATTICAILCLMANVISWLGNVYRLPGNWIIVANSTLFLALFSDTQRGIGWGTITFLVVLALLGDSAAYALRRLGRLSIEDRVPGVRRILAGAGAGSFVGGVIGFLIPIIGPLMAIAGSMGGAAAGAYVGTWLSPASASKKPRKPLSARLERLSEPMLKILPRMVAGLLMLLVFLTFAF